MNLFEKEALSLFTYQFEHNPVYRSFCDLTNVNPADVKSALQIPFLPITFFKTHRVSCKKEDAFVFESSGTGGVSSKHHVASLSQYEASFRKGFAQFYGQPEEYHILALLPGYIERPNASLLYMCRDLISKAKLEFSGFYLNQFEALHKALKTLDKLQKPTILIGVSFALLDFCEKYRMQLQHTTIMETGGMKGRRKELVREELHQLLKKGFGVSEIHSEYGMTEMLSQAYSKGKGLFHPSKSMRVLIRDIHEPNKVSNTGSGGINIIDLSNKYSCAFMATQDLGKCHADGTFEVLGRYDASDIRGCSLMTA